MTVLPDPDRNGFFATLQGKLIASLTIVALVMGVVMEGISIWRNLMETHTSTEVSINAKDRQDAETRNVTAQSAVAPKRENAIAAKAAADACLAEVEAAVKTVDFFAPDGMAYYQKHGTWAESFVKRNPLAFVNCGENGEKISTAVSDNRHSESSRCLKEHHRLVDAAPEDLDGFTEYLKTAFDDWKANCKPLIATYQDGLEVNNYMKAKFDRVTKAAMDEARAHEAHLAKAAETPCVKEYARIVANAPAPNKGVEFLGYLKANTADWKQNCKPTMSDDELTAAQRILDKAYKDRTGETMAETKARLQKEHGG
jgi:hypothetical protein